MTPGTASSGDSRPEIDLPRAEPTLRIGLAPPRTRLRFFLSGRFVVGDTALGPGWCDARAEHPDALVKCGDVEIKMRSPLLLTPVRPAGTFTIPGIEVGAGFHWRHTEDLTFGGTLELLLTPAQEIVAVNRVGLEEYLESVVSSEMNPEAPSAFLKAHAVVARSWALAQLRPRPPVRDEPPPGLDIWEWFDRENHDLFDLCADDHCQRYHGQTRRVGTAVDAVKGTRGMVLSAQDEVVDARFSKCCGGMTELFATAWGGPGPPGIDSVVDAPEPPLSWPLNLTAESDAQRWIRGRPPVECAVDDAPFLPRIMLPMDRPTADFFRWVEQYSQERLSSLVEEKTHAGLGQIKGLRPLRRGPSGRIEIVEIRGSRGSLRVGKELSIRRLLSPTHLKSSAFTPVGEDAIDGIPRRFRLHGAGWGHGVGMCQIGAGAMAARGAKSPKILARYFPRATVVSLY